MTRSRTAGAKVSRFPVSLSFSLFLFIWMISFWGCSEDSTGTTDGDTAPDGDTDAFTDGDSTEDDAEADAEADGDAPACDFEEARCEGDDILTCEDGQPVVTPCESGTYCNYGVCREKNVFFPEDAGYHAERSEWWYYTGHLSDGSNRWGFEVTIFQYDIEETFHMPGYGYMCHVAVTDKTAGEHYHYDAFALDPVKWSNDPVKLYVETCEFRLGGDGTDTLTAWIPEGKEKDGKVSPWKLNLAFQPRKRPALHGGDGIIPMSDAGGTSWYYSYTRLDAAGKLETPAGDFDVSGQAWMDHQWGQFDISEFKGWDWWSMQFTDDTEIMLFQFTNWDGELDSQAGTIIDAAGNVKELEGLEAFSVESLRSWESPHTDGVYPLDWDIRIPEENWSLRVVTHIDDQEMYNAAQNYWEGDTEISGTRGGESVDGVGYTELTGYATDILDPD